MMIEFNTNEYRFSHGHNPRGMGSWAFAIGSQSAEPIWFKGTFTEAKKQCRTHLKSQGVKYATIYVLS